MSVFGSIFDDDASGKLVSVPKEFAPALPPVVKTETVHKPSMPAVPIKQSIPPAIDDKNAVPKIRPLNELLNKKKTDSAVVPVVTTESDSDDVFAKAHLMKDIKDKILDDIKDVELKAIFQESVYDFLPYVGMIVRTCPFDKETLSEPALIALKKYLDEFGVTEIMPKVYENRLKYNIAHGYVQADGQGFTEKGQTRATHFLVAKGYDVKSAQKRVKKARALKHDEQRKQILKSGQVPQLKFGFGYHLDNKGLTVKH